MQRVPRNDNRRHSSTITVAILEEPARVETILRDSDLRVDTYKSGGKGGQSAQKNDTAVRITHLPTGLVAACEQERSQWRNLQLAKRVVAARLNALERQSASAGRNQSRRAQFGGAERSERVWTWQFQRDQVTHHPTGRRWKITALENRAPL